METKVLIEKFNGFEIFFDKESERFIAEKPDVDRKFEATRLWDIKGAIKDSQTEEIRKQAYIVGGYFVKEIHLIDIMTHNKAWKKYKYKVIGSTANSYDVGRTFDDELKATYPLSEENKNLFKEVSKLENEIKNLESQQRKLVSQLKKGE